MRVAAIQFKAQKGRPQESLSSLSQLIVAAGEHGAKLIVCPEMALTGYLFADGNAAGAVAESKDGAGLASLGALAVRFEATIVCGYAERGRGRLYNSARVIGPDGQLVYNYRKRLLYDSDLTWAADGDTRYPLLAMPGLKDAKLSVGICMDLNDDRFTAFLRRMRPRLVAFCTNWLDQGQDVLPYWQYRLLGTQSYFIAANTYGSEEEPGHPLTRFCGGSTILDPSGQPLARAPHAGDAVVLADIPEEI